MKPEEYVIVVTRLGGSKYIYPVIFDSEWAAAHKGETLNKKFNSYEIKRLIPQ